METDTVLVRCSSRVSKRRAAGTSGALSLGPSKRNEALADRHAWCPESAAWGSRAKDGAAACPGHRTWKKSSPASQRSQPTGKKHHCWLLEHTDCSEYSPSQHMWYKYFARCSLDKLWMGIFYSI